MTHGILLLDKPQGLSSNAAVQRVRHAFGRIKAGHTGSLDPLATGMLPVCLGEATKVAGFLLDGDKCYEFTARFGARTTTGDLEGPLVETAPVPGDLDHALMGILPKFTGPVEQVPPMYSALKRDGQPLYRLARQGIEVEREARCIHIHTLQLLEVTGNDARMSVRCSKGTYVRTLAEDLARAVGSHAHLVMLRRTAVLPFDSQKLVTLDEVLANSGSMPLLPPDAALLHLPAARLPSEMSARFRQGQVVAPPEVLASGLTRVYHVDGQFLGIAEADGEGRLKPVRIFNDLDAH
ncbi:MAG: tRNA pseudouridine(55) synthase TruB [Pseudomonadota bacterium]